MPAFAKPRTHAPPMPPAPPVTRATLPLSSILRFAKKFQIPDYRFQIDRTENLESGMCNLELSPSPKLLGSRLVDHPIARQLHQIVGIPRITNRYAVMFLGLCWCDIAFDYVPKNFLWLSLKRIPVPAAAG